MRLLYCKSELSALIYFSLRYLRGIGLEPSLHVEESRYRRADEISESRSRRRWEGGVTGVNVKGGLRSDHAYEKGGGKKGGGKKGSGKGGGKKGYEKGVGKGGK